MAADETAVWGMALSSGAEQLKWLAQRLLDGVTSVFEPNPVIQAPEAGDDDFHEYDDLL